MLWSIIDKANMCNTHANLLPAKVVRSAYEKHMQGINVLELTAESNPLLFSLSTCVKRREWLTVAAKCKERSVLEKEEDECERTTRQSQLKKPADGADGSHWH